MMMMTEAPDELFVDVKPSAATRATGEVLGRVCDLPVGPWTAVLLAEVDVSKLTSWELPVYLTACARLQAWAAGLGAGGVLELSSRPDVVGVDKEVALALSEPVGVAQQRIAQLRRMRRLLPETWSRFRYGELSQKHAEKMVEAINGVDDPKLAAEVEERSFRSLGQKTAAELRKHARR